MSATVSGPSRTVVAAALCVALAAAFAVPVQRAYAASENVPSQLLSDDERVDFCTQMRTAPTPDARRAVTTRLRDTLAPRARGQQVELPGWVRDARPAPGAAGATGDIPGLSCVPHVARPRAPVTTPSVVSRSTPLASEKPAPGAPVASANAPKNAQINPPPNTQTNVQTKASVDTSGKPASIVVGTITPTPVVPSPPPLPSRPATSAAVPPPPPAAAKAPPPVRSAPDRRLTAREAAARDATALTPPPTAPFSPPPVRDPVIVDAQRGDIPVAHDRGIPYVTGGVGQDEATALRGMASGYNMRATFVTRSGEYLSGVTVQIYRGSTVVFSARSEGPYLFARLPPGRYRLVATSNGVSRTHELFIPTNSGTRVTMSWSM